MKLVDDTQLDSGLTSIANAIRAKGGTSASLAFPGGFVSAVGNIPTGITPTGTIGITSNGNTDVTNYATASVNVSPVLTLGAIRPDAEVWQEYKEDTLLVADKGVTIPAYSTSNQTLVTGSEIVNLSVSDSYEYYATWRSIVYPIYNTNAIAAGREEYSACMWSADLTKYIPFSDLQNTKTSDLPAASDSDSRHSIFYWSSSTTLKNAASSYGVYRNIPQVTFNYTSSEKKLRISTSNIIIRGSTTYLTQSYFESITDIRSQYILQVWRAPKDGLNLSGWMMNQLTQNVADAISSASHTLT